MRKLLAALSAAVLVAVGATSIVSAGGDPFTRSWSAVDVDGSVMTLSILGTGETRTVTWVDQRATFCEGGVYEVNGPATIVGNEIRLDGSGGCVVDDPVPGDWTWTYQAASDTLTDGTVAYHRGNRAREAFLGVWKATDNFDSSAMKLTFRGSGLERTVSFLDDLASACDPEAVFMAEGTGVIGSEIPWGRYITVSLAGGCVGGASITIDDGKFLYEVATDTLRGPLDPDLDPDVEPYGELNSTVTWHRG